MANTNPITIMIFTIMCTITSFAAASDADLSAYRWKNRLLLIFAASTEDTSFSTLNKRISQAALEIEDRDMIIFRVFEYSPSWVAEKPLLQRDAEVLRRNFQISPGQFSVVLVGKDGGIKMTQQRDVDLQSIFSLIDSMPMRQQEMREKNNN